MGDFKSNLDLLRWFKGFYTTNVKDGEYDPVKARDNSDISPVLQHLGKNLTFFKTRRKKTHPQSSSISSL